MINFDNMINFCLHFPPLYIKNSLGNFFSSLQLDDDLVNSLEQRVDSIMSLYDIDNLVINSKDRHTDLFIDFEKRYNKKHKSKMIIK